MTPLNAMQQGALVLGLFALITAGSVATLRGLTAERIDTHQQAYQQRQHQAVLPDPLKNAQVSSISLPNASQLGFLDGATGWQVDNDTQRALVLPVVTQRGYNGEIRLLVGIDDQQRISGVRVTHHQETPGLGDDIERRRSDWITQFDGLTLDSLPSEGWGVTQDGGQFDAFTGATITPRAVVDAVHSALQYATSTPLLGENKESQP
ncbi:MULTISPECIES: RnfABCDGE type electron transport complex subunit G [unclassified Halomonas]|uniref:RnfABCDGE type electron transport complex subunit G n=1 Tax=unclassified Halomonas TaxID=2609666 RepID=UPI0006DA0D33|nr:MULTISPECIES: RnfABCDGE type electron transport complex subunit G [unclassified Halomonas]KPQ26971.1 MAG: electron transport complex protein RnfG [Halomonas sp. HL-93]SBR49021.1 electron transport complex protein RnfG [Halomonas sp. HL-93]SNY95991.1 electron transport complex protein RnfG [Halomonas sp. hl-4]